MTGIFSDRTLQEYMERNPRIAQFVSGSGTGENIFGAILQAVEVVGVAGTMSYMNARHAAAGRQAYEVAGVPADLALGLMFAGLAASGYFGKHSTHGHNVGNGFLTAYACRMGTMWGAAAKAQLAGPGAVRGSFGQGNGVAGSSPMAQPQPVEAAAGQQYPWAS